MVLPTYMAPAWGRRLAFGLCPLLALILLLASPPASVRAQCNCNCDTCCCQDSGGCGGEVSGKPQPFCDPSCGCCSSPIIVDTTGHGFHLTSARDGVDFDIHADGKPVLISWTAADSGNAFLALDRNHNGRIDNGKELFGNITDQPKSNHPNGYRDGTVEWHIPKTRLAPLPLQVNFPL